MGVPPIVAKGCEAEPLVAQFNAGRTFEPLSDAELTSAILDLADRRDERDRVRQNCVALARRFDRDVIAEQTEAILLAVAEGRPLPEVTW